MGSTWRGFVSMHTEIPYARGTWRQAHHTHPASKLLQLCGVGSGSDGEKRQWTCAQNL